MKNSGYVAIGHLIGGKSKEEIVKTLKHFISVMFKALDDDMINKVDFEWNLDKFMEKMPKGTPITLQAFCKLLDGVLKKHGTDDIMFQRNVEALVWDMVKEDLIKAEVFQKHPNIIFSNIFQMFCLYNRFCDPTSLPLKLNYDRAKLFFSKLDIPLTTRVQESFSTEEFFEILLNNSKNDLKISAGKIKKLFDEVVRFVLHQDQVTYKLIRNESKLMAWKSIVSKPTRLPSPIVVTYRDLLIYENESENSTCASICDPNQQSSLCGEPHGKIAHTYSLFDAVVQKKSNNFFSKNRNSQNHLVIYLKHGEVNVELIFANNVKENENKIQELIQAINRSSIMCKSDSDPLTVLYLENRLTVTDSASTNLISRSSARNTPNLTKKLDDVFSYEKFKSKDSLNEDDHPKTSKDSVKDNPIETRDENDSKQLEEINPPSTFLDRKTSKSSNKSKDSLNDSENESNNDSTVKWTSSQPALFGISTNECIDPCTRKSFLHQKIPKNASKLANEKEEKEPESPLKSTLFDQNILERPSSNPDSLLEKNSISRKFNSGLCGYESDRSSDDDDENSQKLPKTAIFGSAKAGTNPNPKPFPNTRKTRTRIRPSSLNLKEMPRRRMSMSYSPTFLRKEILKEEEEEKTEEKGILNPLESSMVKMRPVKRKPPSKPPRKTLLRVSVMKT